MLSGNTRSVEGMTFPHFCCNLSSSHLMTVFRRTNRTIISFDIVLDASVVTTTDSTTPSHKRPSSKSSSSSLASQLQSPSTFFIIVLRIVIIIVRRGRTYQSQDGSLLSIYDDLIELPTGFSSQLQRMHPPASMLHGLWIVTQPRIPQHFCLRSTGTKTKTACTPGTKLRKRGVYIYIYIYTHMQTPTIGGCMAHRQICTAALYKWDSFCFDASRV